MTIQRESVSPDYSRVEVYDFVPSVLESTEELAHIPTMFGTIKGFSPDLLERSRQNPDFAQWELSFRPDHSGSIQDASFVCLSQIKNILNLEAARSYPSKT